MRLPPPRSECARQPPAPCIRLIRCWRLGASSRLDDAADGCVSVCRRENPASHRYTQGFSPAVVLSVRLSPIRERRIFKSATAFDADAAHSFSIHYPGENSLRSLGDQTLILVRHHIDVRCRSSRRSTCGRIERHPPVPERDGCRRARSRMSSAHWRVRRAAWPSSAE